MIFRKCTYGSPSHRWHRGNRDRYRSDNCCQCTCCPCIGTGLPDKCSSIRRCDPRSYSADCRPTRHVCICYSCIENSRSCTFVNLRRKIQHKELLLPRFFGYLITEGKTYGRIVRLRRFGPDIRLWYRRSGGRVCTGR